MYVEAKAWAPSCPAGAGAAAAALLDAAAAVCERGRGNARGVEPCRIQYVVDLCRQG